MHSESPSTAPTPDPPSFAPEPAKLDLASVKVQLTCGAFLILATCFVSYWSSLRIGFLLDDFLHIHYAATAVAGHWSPLIHNLTGNWADSDIMQSYRPISSLSIFLDYLIWGVHAVGFHLTNVLLLFLASLFVSLITLELTGLYGNRLGALPALWSGLLFAIYPLHPESVAWIIGRVDLLCTLFYLASLFAYLRFRLLREPVYLGSSLFLFLLALASKEQAVTLPVVIALAELCLWTKISASKMLRQKSQTLKHQTADATIGSRLRWVGYFWLVLTAYAITRGIILGTLVGGYGTSGLKQMLSSWRTFADRPTLWKIIIPANEEVKISGLILPLLLASYLGGLVSLVVRLVSRSARVGPFLFLIGWMAIAVVPAFQIWHIYPNLVGSRLFFMASAPFCIFVTLALMPGIDALKRKHAQAITAVATLLLLCIYLSWAQLVKANMQPWQTAGAIMTGLRAQLEEILATVPASKRVVFLDLPTDFSGAGLLTRPQYLEIVANRPFAAADLSNRLLSIEPPIQGSHDFMWSHKFASTVNKGDLAGIFQWDQHKFRFSPWNQTDSSNSGTKAGSPIATGSNNFSYSASTGDTKKLTITPACPITAPVHHENAVAGAHIENHRSFLRIFPGASGVTLLLPPTRLNPLTSSIVAIDMEARKSTGCTHCFGGKVQFVWKSEQNSSSSATCQSTDNLHQANVLFGTPGHYLIPIGRFRRWTLDGAVTQIGLRVEPGDVFVDLRALAVEPDSSVLPRLEWDRCSLTHPGDPACAWQIESEPGRKLTVKYDASLIPGADLVRLLITDAGYTFDALSERDIISPYPPAGDPNRLYEQEVNGATGSIMLPDSAISAPGLHQIRLIALDRHGFTLGLPSEPVSVMIKASARRR